MKLLKLARIALMLAIVLTAVTSAVPALAQEPPPGQPPPPEGGGGRGGEIVDALRQIAQVVIDILIGIAAILMAVGIATGFVGGQFMVTVGQPYGLSAAWVKVIAVVILGIGAMLTIVLVNTIIDIVGSLIPATVIPIV
ncbi:MAG: hypothetical protein SXV54_19755 [Chloroflexota bacterium]|nr:hypothetical protein [Chloroflexota bacterium]